MFPSRYSGADPLASADAPPPATEGVFRLTRSPDEVPRRVLIVDDDASVRERLQALVDAAGFGYSDDMLTYTRLRDAPMLQQNVAMSTLVDEVRADLTTALAGRQIVWEIGSLPSVSGDEGMLRQVWHSLLDNAVKFTRRQLDGRIVIGSRTTDSSVVFYVRDNGVGFDMQYANKLFAVFERLHHPSEFEGNGIGLACARRLVERHKGRVWAEGRLEAGAVFYFELPGRG